VDELVDVAEHGGQRGALALRGERSERGRQVEAGLRHDRQLGGHVGDFVLGDLDSARGGWGGGFSVETEAVVVLGRVHRCRRSGAAR
jgi:hypothetical protein